MGISPLRTRAWTTRWPAGRRRGLGVGGGGDEAEGEEGAWVDIAMWRSRQADGRRYDKIRYEVDGMDGEWGKGGERRQMAMGGGRGLGEEHGKAARKCVMLVLDYLIWE